MKIKLLTVIAVLGLLSFQNVFSQCDPSTPVFTINLTGSPDSIWVSPLVFRNGNCCTGTGVNCVAFIITLDPGANGISFNVASGALPIGALFYQVNCGPQTPIGTPICLNGVGPHIITFCKPGGNANTYSITSIPQPSLSGNIVVSQACAGTLTAQGLNPASITWTSVPNNPTYNSYLSCQAGCSTTIVTPTPGYPAFVDYQVCGSVVGACGSVNFCDTARVYFVNNLAVNITPLNPVLCNGPGNTLTVTANPTGGFAPYVYSWSTGQTTQSILVGPGTYTVTLTDSMNCSTATSSVTVTALPSAIVVNAGPDLVMCTNVGSVPLNGLVQVATGGQWSGGNGTFSPNTTTLNASYTPTATEISSGTVILTLTSTGNGGCPAITDAMTISIVPSPSTSIAGSTFLCAGSTANYSVTNVAGNTYAWSATGGSITGSNNTNSINITWGSGSSGTVTVTQTNPQGCDSTVSVNVSIMPLPVVAISGPSAVCKYNNGTYSVASVAGNTYSWSAGGGTIFGSSTSNTVNVIWGSSNTGTVTVTQTSAWGCSTTATMNVTLNSQPTPVISGNTTVCQNTNSTYAVFNAAGNTFSWNVTGGNITSGANTNSINVLWGSGSSGVVTITQTNPQGCDSTVTINISIMPPPAPVITGSNVVCATSSVSYSVANAGGNFYNWSVTGGSIVGPANSSSINVTWGAQGSGTVSITQTNQWGCIATVSLNVTIAPLPVVSVTTPPYLCSDAGSSFSVNLSSGQNALWSVVGGTVNGPNNTSTLNVNWSSGGFHTVTVIVTSSSGCSTTSTSNVFVEAPPVPVISGPAPVCEFDTGYYSVAFVSGHFYIWNVIGGSIIGFSVGNTIDVQWGGFGQGEVSCRQISPAGCDSTVKLLLTINSRPNPFITGTVNVCENSDINYFVSTNPGSNYTWTVNGGTINGNSNSPVISVHWNVNGSGTVTVTETNNTGCSVSTTIPVTIMAKPVPVITGNSNGCLTANGNYSSPWAVNSNYMWSAIGGNIVSGNGTNSVSVGWVTTGNNTITLTVVNTATGCDSTVTFNVVVTTLNPPVVTAANMVGCAPLGVQFTGNVASQGQTYQWNFGDALTSSSVNPSHIYYNAGVYTVTITTQNAGGCSATATATVTVYAVPNASFTHNYMTDDYYVGESMLIFNNTSTNGTNYMWTFGNGDTSNFFEPLYSYHNPGNYVITLYVSNNLGCKDTAVSSIRVRLHENLFIPNAFSPNFDEKNDYFSVTADNMKNFNIIIFNRWGQIIYTSDDKNFHWDGTYNGSRVQQGIYGYIITAKGYTGDEKTINGTLTLVR
ncbi:MAG: gliding motility-associated C-terminal domain-containing protein [Bacteroidia bacterium]|nr:gliding motility-associated C-terminal domain-containing protein [Bacteroidia bacterium]